MTISALLVFAFGLALLGTEMLVAGFGLLWFGAAALLVALSTMVFPEMGWIVQLILFSVLSLVTVPIGLKVFPTHAKDTDEPLLNDRLSQMIGRVAVLEDPIIGGEGRGRFGDTLWRIQGPDLAAGSTIRVIAAQAGVLSVEPVPSGEQAAPEQPESR